MHKEASIRVAFRFYPGPGIPENILEFLEGTSMQPIKFDMPASGIISLNSLLPEKLPGMTRCAVVGDCDVEQEQDVILGIGVDWSWCAWLNGKLVCDARVSRNSEHTFEPDDHLVRCHLQKGHNQFAFEVANGLSFQFAFKLFEDEERKLKWSPLVHFPDASQNAVTITFALDDIAPGGVLYRRQGQAEWTRIYDTLGGQIRRDKTVHNINLLGLEPDADYEYQVFCLDEPSAWGLRPLGEIGQFHTLPGEGRPFSFVASADAQHPEKRVNWMKSFFKRDYVKNASFFAYLGDVLWTSNFESAVMDGFVAPFQDASGNRKLLQFVRGNHEYYGKDSQRFFAYFSAQRNGKDGYSMFRCGDVCFIVLDFGDDAGPCPYPSTRALHSIEGYLEEQARWLAAMVKQPICSEAKFRIVLAHAIPFGDWRTYLERNIHPVIDPIFGGENPACRIHLWLGGHVHYPFRSIPFSNDFRSNRIPKFEADDLLCGKNYGFPVVVFSGPSAVNPPEMQISDVCVSVTGNQLVVSSHDMNGQEYDRFSIDTEGKVTEQFSSPEFKLVEMK